MCNYDFASVKPLSQNNLATYSLFLTRDYSKKVKAHKIASMKCGNVKSEIGGSKLSTRVFIPWFG